MLTFLAENILAFVCFAAGFAACWFWRSKVERAVIATNAAVVEVKSAASTVSADIKKL